MKKNRNQSKRTAPGIPLDQLRLIAQGLGQTFAPFCEVVLHDLTNPAHAILSIHNNLSGRDVGQPATEPGLARIADPDYPPVIANYANRFEDGRQVKSTSIGIKDADGNYMEVRRSAEIIAAYLGVSRATIYSDT